MFSALKKLLGVPEAAPTERAAPIPSPTERLNPGPPFHQGDPNQPVPRWPSKGAALVAASPEDLIATQHELIAKMRGLSPLPYAEFDRLLLPVFIRFAAWAHLLPASESHHHCGPGGLLRHSLEVCLHVTRKAEGTHVGVDLVPSQRTLYSPRWKVAVALAGLLHDIGKPLVDIGAVDESGKLTWAPQSMSLFAWLQQHQLQHYYLFWRPGSRVNRHKIIASSVAREIIGQEVLDWLSEGGSEEVVDLLMVAIADTEVHNPMATLVHYGDSTSVRLDMAEQEKNSAGSGEGASRSIAAKLLAAIRARVDSGEWRVNRHGDPLWYTDQGFFGVYPLIIEGPVEDLRRSGARSLPAGVTAYLGLLEDYNHIDIADNGRGERAATWWLTLHPTDASSRAMPALKVIRFSSAQSLVGALPLPAPAPATLAMPFASDKLAALKTTEAQASLPLPEPGAGPPEAAPGAPSVAPHDAEPAPGESAALPDRRNRADLADATSVEQQRRQQQRGRAEAVPDSFAGWLAKIEDTGFEGNAMASILRGFEAGTLHYGEHAHLGADTLALRYPEAFANEGIEPGDLLEGMHKLGWLLAETSSDRKVSEHDFGDGARSKCLILANAPYFAMHHLQLEQPALFKPGPRPAAKPAPAPKAESTAKPAAAAAPKPAAERKPAKASGRGKALPTPDPARSLNIPAPAAVEPELPRRPPAGSAPTPPISAYQCPRPTDLTPLKAESMAGEFYWEMELAARRAGQSGPHALASATIHALTRSFATSRALPKSVLNLGLLGGRNPVLFNATNPGERAIVANAVLTVHSDYEAPAWLKPYLSKVPAQNELPIS